MSVDVLDILTGHRRDQTTVPCPAPPLPAPKITTRACAPAPGFTLARMALSNGQPVGTLAMVSLSDLAPENYYDPRWRAYDVTGRQLPGGYRRWQSAAKALTEHIRVRRGQTEYFTLPG